MTYPSGLFFAGTIVVVTVAIEAGFWLGKAAHRRSEDEKESPVSAIAGAILGLAAFMLAFTFGIVWDRYDARKGLVRDDAVAIRTAWQRSDFLPEPDRAEAAALLRQYVDLRVAFAEARSLEPESVKRLLSETQQAAGPPVEHGGRERAEGHELGRCRAVHRVAERGERDPCDASGDRDPDAGSRRDLARALLHHASSG